jgi:membrane-associated phospholipid phosphatase
MSSMTTMVGQRRGDVLRRHALLAGLSIGYFALATLVAWHFQLAVDAGPVRAVVVNFLKMLPQMIFLVLFWRLIQLTYVEKVPDRIQRLKAETRAFLSETDRMISAGLAVLLMSMTFVAFAKLKSALPQVQPFAWDTSFLQLDLWLHFGFDPYRLLHSVLGFDLALSFFAGFYNYWLFLTYFVVICACFARPERVERMQFMLAFLFTWALGGNVLAMVFSSAGPPYFHLLGLGDHFVPLFERLGAHAAQGGLSVVATQELLWEVRSRSNGPNLISAFPSMHVASSVLMAIYGFTVARWIGLALSAFALAIMIGSVLLGWHYAVDGYAGAVIALVAWRFCGWLVRSRIGPFHKARGQGTSQ